MTKPILLSKARAEEIKRGLEPHKLTAQIKTAVELVLSGKSQYEAAKLTGASESGIYRAMQRINAARDEAGKHLCPCCGRKL